MPRRLSVQAWRPHSSSLSSRLLLQRINAARMCGGHLQSQARCEQDRCLPSVSSWRLVQPARYWRLCSLSMSCRPFLSKSDGIPRTVPRRNVPIAHRRKVSLPVLDGTRGHVFWSGCCGPHGVPELNFLPPRLRKCHHMPCRQLLPAKQLETDHLPEFTLLSVEDGPCISLQTRVVLR